MGANFLKVLLCPTPALRNPAGETNGKLDQFLSDARKIYSDSLSLCCSDGLVGLETNRGWRNSFLQLTGESKLGPSVYSNLKKVWDDGNGASSSTDILRAHALLLNIDIINQWVKFLGTQFDKKLGGNWLVANRELETRLKDMLATQLEFIELFMALCNKLDRRAALIDERHLQRSGTHNWHLNRRLATNLKDTCFEYLSAGCAQQSIFRIKQLFDEIKDELTTTTFDPVHLPKIAPLNNLLVEVRKFLPLMREEFELAPQSADSYFSPSKEGCLYQLRPTKRSFGFANDWQIGYYVAHSDSLYRYKFPLGDMLKYHERIDLAAYDISCIVDEETTCFSANDSWWLLLEHNSGNHEIKMKAPPHALDRGLLSEKKYVEGWVKDLKRLRGKEEEEQPVPEPFDIVCRKCWTVFSLETAEKHDSSKCGGAAMGWSNTYSPTVAPDEFSDDSEDDSEESDSDDDEVVEWETFIGFVEKSAAEQQKMADEFGLDVEVLRASAQKPAAKEVKKVQLLHQRVVMTLHQRLECLKRRREELLQSRLQQPLTQDRVAMMDLMWVETVEVVAEGDSTADLQPFFDAR
jgi:hypothetical protein